MEPVSIVYTIEEVSKILKLHRNTVCKMIKEGKIKSFKIGNSIRVPALEIQNIVTAKNELYVPEGK